MSVRMAIPVVLSSISFPTKSAALKFVKDDILWGYGLSDQVTDPSHDLLLRELVARGDDSGEKLGGGIAHFFIEKTSGGRAFVSANARGIWIRRVDGSQADWSYVTAINEPSPAAEVKDAMRGAVEERRLSFRDAQFAAGPVTCHRTGAVIADRNNADVVYEDPSWGELTEPFAATHGGWNAIETHSGGGGVKVGRGFVDTRIESDRIDYWDTEARPRLVKNTL